ncbi:MAG TPA: c-type cytochrome domain-containing protein, partial [Vicinamibacterales bacterium]|nr:c-type cytochrome domain-containing protein [Vicinamibacterales bacterium]
MLCAAVITAGAPAAQQPAPVPDYARDVVPILEANCVRCHSPAQQEGGLLLDTYDDLVKGGDSGQAFTAGNAASSRLVAMIEGRAKKKMPPKSDLHPDEIATLRA